MGTDTANWDVILNAYQQMQFQAVSLNDHFATLTKQESELRLKLETLQGELRAMRENNKDSSEVQESLARYVPDDLQSSSLTFKQIQTFADSTKLDRTVLKRIRQDEAFCSSIHLTGAESLLKLQNLLKYIGRYVGEHPPKLGLVLSQREFLVNPNNIMEKPIIVVPESNKLLIPTDKRKATAVKKVGMVTANKAIQNPQASFDDSPVDTVKGEAIVTTPVIKLREAMVEMFPNRKRAISEVILAVVESLPMRISAVALNSKETLSKLKDIGVTNDHLWAEHSVSILLEDSHFNIRQRLFQTYSYCSSLLKAISESTSDLTDFIASRELTYEQQEDFNRERQKLITISAGLPLKDVPDKLWELVRIAFEWKLMSLSRQQKGALALEDDFNSFVTKAQGEAPKLDEEKDPGRATSSLAPNKKDCRDFEAEERAQIDLQRKQMRAGVYRTPPVLSRSRSDFTGQNISKMSAIRRSEDLEKLLLEHVQGIEKKIKQIKYTERQMSTRTSLKFPSLRTTPVAERTKRESSLKFRSNRSPEKWS